MFVVPYILVTYVLFKSNWMYNILFSWKVFLLYMFRMSHTSIVRSTTVVYSHRFCMVLVCLFHGAGTGVGTLWYFSTVSFSVKVSQHQCRSFGTWRHMNALGYCSLGETGEWRGWPSYWKGDAGQKWPNVTTNNKNIRFNITVSTFPNCDQRICYR
jgi:hypothetical protein